MGIGIIAVDEEQLAVVYHPIVSLLRRRVYTSTITDANATAVDILNNIETLPPRIDPSLTSSSSPGFDHHAEGRTLLRYIFPRQHGLHNVFTCDPTDGLNRKEKWGKAGIARDYTTRKEEIEVGILGYPFCKQQELINTLPC